MESTYTAIPRPRMKDESVEHFFQSMITEMQNANRIRTAETYLSSYRSFARFLSESFGRRKTGDLKKVTKMSGISFSQLDANLIKSYEQYLIGQRKLCMNTVSFYLRTLRAVCNAAAERGIVGCRTSFQNVYTGIAPTEKRAIPIDAIRQLKNMDLHGRPAWERARDFFLFSFCTRGMAFIDMAYLKKADLRNNVLQYRRRKTGQLLTIGWEDCMQAILDRHPSSSGIPYLLPIIQRKGNERAQYRNALFLTNHYLKQIGSFMNLPFPLTTYTSRHSWATVARNQNIPLSVISECLGHTSERTTRIYLAALDTSVMDEANRKILELL